MAFNNKSFRYQPLDISKRQIRIVTLQPKVPYLNTRCDISCKLRTVSLGDKPKYEALSYVWGDPTKTRTILLDRVRFNVTENLYLALLRLRDPFKSRDLWIDSICINQKDPDERSRQVKLMGCIYEGASEGLLWVGEDNEEAQEGVSWADSSVDPGPNTRTSCDDVGYLFEIFRSLANDQHLHFLSVEDCNTVQNKLSRLSLLDTRVLKCFKSFAQREWWDRAWVVQETILPLSAKLICGSYSLAWDKVERAAQAWFQHSRGCCRGIQGNVSEIQCFFGNVLSLSRARKARVQNKHNNVAKTLLAFSHREASDPRDRIFAYLGLFPDTAKSPMASQITVDYKVSKEVIYKEIIRSSIHITDSLDILIHPSPNSLDNLIYPSPEGPATVHTPSWAIDWTLPVRPFGVTKIGYDRSSYYRASRGKTARAVFQPNSILSLSGIFIDKVTEVGNVMHEISWPQLIETSEHWENTRTMCLKRNPYLESATYPAGGGSLQDAYWRTLLGNLISTVEYYNEEQGDPYRSVKDEDYEVYQRWWKSVKDGAGVLDSFGYMIAGTFLTKTFFVTDCGYYGLGPQNMKAEDEVYVLFGSNVPFVLRPNPNRDFHALSMDSGLFLRDGFHCYLVGDCYVHGFMNGEALDDEQRRVQSVFLY
ncbi:hypothetical protein BP6252_03439 [Coleophoma cylindrospora]|uniref:Heterokaryon incompatibility domain-containing protein n=1 Tax=Coleophoma cylindrospora TaxID=1849047 RepID=A0A3D8S7N8_9HELO|nr:hypothetical protein BP6252_03439 [Coleophoma cylindrospora]